MADREVVYRSHADVLAEEGARNRITAFEEPISEAPQAGGIYLVNDVEVDANGVPLKKQKDAPKEESSEEDSLDGGDETPPAPQARRPRNETR